MCLFLNPQCLQVFGEEYINQVIIIMIFYDTLLTQLYINYSSIWSKNSIKHLAVQPSFSQEHQPLQILFSCSQTMLAGCTLSDSVLDQLRCFSVANWKGSIWHYSRWTGFDSTHCKDSALAALSGGGLFRAATYFYWNPNLKSWPKRQ